MGDIKYRVNLLTGEFLTHIYNDDAWKNIAVTKANFDDVIKLFDNTDYNGVSNNCYIWDTTAAILREVDDLVRYVDDVESEVDVEYEVDSLNDRFDCKIDSKKFLELTRVAPGYNYDIQETVLYGIKLVYGRVWEVKTLRGYQKDSDWIEVAYDTGVITAEELSRIENVFFGLIAEIDVEDVSAESAINGIIDTDDNIFNLCWSAKSIKELVNNLKENSILPEDATAANTEFSKDMLETFDLKKGA